MAYSFEISRALIEKFATGPSKPKVDTAKSLREDVEEALGADYRVFLQGSYKNHTGVAELNDVDIVALANTVRSTVGGPPPSNPVSWDEIFSRVERRLANHWRFAGLIERGDKCVKVDTDLALDVVPAIYVRDPAIDPVEVYSFREREPRNNYPRDHWESGADKNSEARTDGAFKPTVRLFKRWARNVLDDPTLAPSFYIECAVHAVPDDEFHAYLPFGYLRVGLYLCQQMTRTTYLPSVAGDKDILVRSEWHPDNFEAFQRALADSVLAVNASLEASTATEADRLWREAFSE